jgi:Ca-activated chloride channel family protein
MCNRYAVPVMEQPQLIYVLTELTPGEGIANTRLPMNFALLLDHSGSMAGEKLRTMKEAVKNIIDQLGSEDIISVITFESKTQVIAPAQPARDKLELKRKIDRIKDAGGTNMAPGLHEALKQVVQQHREGRVSRIVLLTDGEATDNEEDSRRVADEAGAWGIPIIGLGFGQDWNEEFLFDLADRSILAAPGSRLGQADYIPAPKDANRIFQEVYQSMQVVAQEVELTIRMVQGLEARRVWQVTPLIKDLGYGVIQGRAIVIPVGQLEKGGAAYLAEIMLPPRPAGPPAKQHGQALRPEHQEAQPALPYEGSEPAPAAHAGRSADQQRPSDRPHQAPRGPGSPRPLCGQPGRSPPPAPVPDPPQVRRRDRRRGQRGYARRFGR